MHEQASNNCVTRPHRLVLKLLLDEIIPANESYGIPSGGTHATIDFLITRLSEQQEVGRTIIKLLDRVQLQIDQKNNSFDELTALERSEFIRAIEEKEPELFSILIKMTYIGYYTDPIIPPLFGLSDKPPHPYGYDVPEESPADIEELVKPVRQRGFCYRKC